MTLPSWLLGFDPIKETKTDLLRIRLNSHNLHQAAHFIVRIHLKFASVILQPFAKHMRENTKRTSIQANIIARLSGQKAILLFGPRHEGFIGAAEAF